MNRVARLLTSDLSVLRWTLGWLSLLLSAGFFASESQNTNYEFLNDSASKAMWATLFAVHGVSLLWLAVIDCTTWLTRTSAGFGLFLWSYVFLSFTIYDPTPINSTEWMLLLPMLIEMWLMSEVRKK